MDSSESPEDFNNPTEAFQHHGMGRSYLQFEDAQHKLETNWHSDIRLDGEVARSISLTRQQTAFDTNQSIPYPNGYLIPTPTMSIAKPSSSGLHQLKTYQHSHIHSDGEGARSLSLARKQTPFNTILPVSYPKGYLDPAPIMNITTKPSNSGLKVNNFFNSGATVNVKSVQMGSFSMQDRNSKALFNSLAESLLREITDDYKLVNGSNLKSLLSAYLVKSSNKSVVLNPIKDQSTQADKNKGNAENDGDEEELYWSNPKKGRQAQERISESSRGDSCILSCQCKKIKCVKLYCKCFAAGLDCSDTCSCQGCLNVKECDDEVRKARELIESRNPLAFAPKVVQHSIEPSASGYGIRRCNCKKSMCVKKYCDCYQSEVGCSDGCRCEGCRNVYGQKGEKGIMKGPLTGEVSNHKTDSSFDSFEPAAPTNDGHNTYLGTDQNPTPSTPFLHSNQEEDESNIWSSLVKYHMWPDPHLHLDNNDSVPETAKETLDPLSSNQELELGNAYTMDEFEFSLPCQTPEETGTSSEVPNYTEWTNSSAPLFSSGSSHYSCASSPNWLGSRISPVPDFRGTELDQVIAYECELHNILKDNQPETLEYPPISLNNVEVSSQNKKRVSPPHDPVPEFGSNSPEGLLNQFLHPRFSRSKILKIEVATNEQHNFKV